MWARLLGLGAQPGTQQATQPYPVSSPRRHDKGPPRRATSCVRHGQKAPPTWHCDGSRLDAFYVCAVHLWLEVGRLPEWWEEKEKGGKKKRTTTKKKQKKTGSRTRLPPYRPARTAYPRPHIVTLANLFLSYFILSIDPYAGRQSSFGLPSLPCTPSFVVEPEQSSDKHRIWPDPVLSHPS